MNIISYRYNLHTQKMLLINISTNTMYIYIYIDDIRINISVFNAAKHSIIATHIANKRNDVHCLVFEHIITISYLVT